jgi:hypothetical protein
MGQYTYYCEVNTRIREYPAGVYKVVADRSANNRWFPALNRIITVSDRVWKQGPRGGVKFVKHRWHDGMWPMGYITNNEKYMREFAWIKLQAKSVS